MLVYKSIALKIAQFALVMLVTIYTPSTLADMQPHGASLNYSQKSLTNAGNPAAPALIVERNDPNTITGGLVDFGGGIEYGDLDDLFEKIDALRDDFISSDEADFVEDSSILTTNDNPLVWDDLFIQYPDLEDRLVQVEGKVSGTAALLALIAAEGYAKAELTSEATFILDENLFGGTLMFSAALKGNSQAVGLFDEINFDVNQAKEQLQTIPDFNENDPIQTLDLSGGITLFYNPENQKTKLTFDNDSVLLVRATKINQFSLSYSRKLHHFENGDLYWGIKPVFYRVGLTNVGARIGDITDSEALFDEIKDTDFIYENGLDLDLGLVWSASNYQLGASLTSLFENTYKYPKMDTRRFHSDNILQKLDHLEEFIMERQLKLEAGIYTKQRHWSLNMELDANAVEGPMRDEYQWLTVTGTYATDSWWLPSVRAGFSRNLAGTKLAYVNAGLTIMKYLNIDLATTLDTVTLGGDDIRRGASIRIGIQIDY